MSDFSHNFEMKNAMHESALQVLFNLAIDKNGTGQLWSKEADW